MTLIAESGATKTECCLLDGGGAVRARFMTRGINAAVMDDDAVAQAVEEMASAYAGVPEVPLRIFFYGAGITGQKAPEALDVALRRVFCGCRPEYGSDLLAAARGLYGNEKGIVAILGTGSNSCLYDGHEIVRNIRPGGFILGDEGSAAALGKAFLADYVKDLLPEDVTTDFRARYGLDYQGVVSLVYGTGGSPSARLAAFAPYILSLCGGGISQEGAEYVRNMAADNFRSFIGRCLSRYGDSVREVRVAGSFGFACKELLTGLGREAGLEFSVFEKTPMDGLVRYHSRRMSGDGDR